MKIGFLSEYFTSVAAKKLSSVEIDSARSNQHEFNGTTELKKVINTSEKTFFDTTFIWMNDNDGVLSEEGSVTWYDSRENHPTRSEYRLYFSKNNITQRAVEGDTLFIAKTSEGRLFIIIAQGGNTVENQLFWLFGLDHPKGNNYEHKEISRSSDHRLDFASKFILEELGLEIEEPESDLLERLLDPFNNKFPSTVEFSRFARETLTVQINPIDDPDHALLELMEWEEKLFRHLERSIVESRLNEGFKTSKGQNVDEFIHFSLSVQNRRKSRAGYAFEDHLSFILSKNKILFTRKAETEHKAKPDFLFPGIEMYRDASFYDGSLTMLGTKTSCKDRWRQILSEAARIREKHLLTLEPGISENQTQEMQGHGVQLVVPESIHASYSKNQQSWLMDVKGFIRLVEQRQLSQ